MLCFCSDLKKPVRTTLEIAEVLKSVGSDRIFFEMPDVEQYWDNHMRLIQNEALNSGQDGHPLLELIHSTNGRNKQDMDHDQDPDIKKVDTDDVIADVSNQVEN